MVKKEKKLIQYINLKLAMLGIDCVGGKKESEFNDLARSLLFSIQEKDRLLKDYLCPADQRIQDFISDYFEDVDAESRIKIPTRTFVLDRLGLARVLSLPANGDKFESDIVNSYRIRQGVLHNPKHDRRTTKGAFHIVEGGAPIPEDKIAVPKEVFYNLFAHAINPPPELMQLPFTSSENDEVGLFVSLYLRPLVCPPVPNYCKDLSMECRFFVPGNLVSNLDFVETIFGNGGDPSLPENDAGLDVDHWTGHTGCVILAPHLIHLTKKELGLPHFDQASERQREQGTCWQKPEELYNDGQAFKVTCRDARGVIVTLIADNYFGYCKKEVKTQISYSANLFGLCEEEHAGGTIAFASSDLGDDFSVPTHTPMVNHTFAEAMELLGPWVDLQPSGYGIDKNDKNIIYVPETVKVNLREQSVCWPHDGREQNLRLLPDKTYILPSGYKVQFKKGTSGQRWRLIGTRAEGTFCHKPCTVSGGGKSEISKPIVDAFIHGPVFTENIEKDFEKVQEILDRNYKNRFAKELGIMSQGRPILSSERSLGSVIQLLTPRPGIYTEEYNAWLESIPRYIRELVFVLKQYYRPKWDENWQSKFSVDVLNGQPGNELKYYNKGLISHFLRVGVSQNGLRRIFGLRRDFNPAVKLQMEDDISVSVVVPSEKLAYLNPEFSNPCVKFVQNCESRLFQRPDDAVIRGYDKRTESDLSQPDNFLSNFQPLDLDEARNLRDDTIRYDQYTKPMQNLIKNFIKERRPTYVVSSAHPRLVNGTPTRNPRYLQMRQDLIDRKPWYLAEIGTRLYRRIPNNQPVYMPINAVVPGRRNNPADVKSGIPPLAVYNPIHYMELPELFIEFICSITGKSPSTTGAGSEGALTKGPFNALHPIIDLNNALVSHILTDYSCFITAAGYVGPNYRVDHDISLIIPELWCRMRPQEKDPGFLISNNYLERCEDLQWDGKSVLASRLGYRINANFVTAFLGRIFNNPGRVFRSRMLKPEEQDMETFVEGMNSIVLTHRRVGAMYFNDGGIEWACPPLKALLFIMRDDEFEGKGLSHPDIRKLFTRENLLNSDWYKKRLTTKQQIDIRRWQRHVDYLKTFLSKPGYAREASRLGIEGRLQRAEETLNQVSAPQFDQQLRGTIGADSFWATD